MNVVEMATKYYPKLWDIERLKALVVANKLSADDYKTIIGEDYSN